MFRFRSAVLVLFACLILAAAAGPLQAETLLISVRETVDGKSTLPPLPAVEGVSSSLFEKGHIVFDTGKDDTGKKTSELAEAARSGGAGWLLTVEVAYREKPLEQGVTRVEGSASFTLIDVQTGVTSLAGSVSASNEGREKTVDHRAVGMELGRLVVERVSKAIPAPSL